MYRNCCSPFYVNFSITLYFHPYVYFCAFKYESNFKIIENGHLGKKRVLSFLVASALCYVMNMPGVLNMALG